MSLQPLQNPIFAISAVKFELIGQLIFVLSAATLSIKLTETFS